MSGAYTIAEMRVRIANCEQALKGWQYRLNQVVNESRIGLDKHNRVQANNQLQLELLESYRDRFCTIDTQDYVIKTNAIAECKYLIKDNELIQQENEQMYLLDINEMKEIIVLTQKALDLEKQLLEEKINELEQKASK